MFLAGSKRKTFHSTPCKNSNARDFHIRMGEKKIFSLCSKRALGWVVCVGAQNAVRYIIGKCSLSYQRTLSLRV